MRDYKKLEVWKRSHDLTLAIYRATRAYPTTETFGLASQTRRSAAAVPANIAEGSGRASGADYARFVSYAAASCNETEYHLLLARDLGYIGVDEWTSIAAEVGEIRSMLVALSRRLV
jgi:four helix bundle protein